MLAGESEERLKGCHRSASPVETKHILVEIMLQVLLAHPVVRSRQPRFEVREHPVHAGEELDSVLRMSLRLAPVVIALVGEGAVAAPADTRTAASAMCRRQTNMRGVAMRWAPAATETELPLQLHRRDAWRVQGHRRSGSVQSVSQRSDDRALLRKRYYRGRFEAVEGVESVGVTPWCVPANHV